MRLTLRRKLRNWRRHAWRRGFAIPLLLIAAPAAAAPAWNATREISDAGSAPLNLAAAAGIGPTGDGVVLWNSAKGIDAVVRAAGHHFGTPRGNTGSAPARPDTRHQPA